MYVHIFIKLFFPNSTNMYIVNYVMYVYEFKPPRIVLWSKYYCLIMLAYFDLKDVLFW